MVMNSKIKTNGRHNAVIRFNVVCIVVVSHRLDGLSCLNLNVTVMQDKYVVNYFLK